jgi:hypothetical protein
MRPIKRLLLFAREIGILVLGLMLSSAVAFGLGFIAASGIDAVAFYLGLSLTLIAFFIARRRHRPWKIEYDAVGWQLNRTERKLHPARARYKQIVGQILLWVPSLIAAFVLFFFPVASHLAHPRSHYLPGYRVPIPWTFTALTDDNWAVAWRSTRGRALFGMTTGWRFDQSVSTMNFVPRDGDPGPLRSFSGATQMVDRNLRARGLSFGCRQMTVEHSNFSPSHGEPILRVECESSAGISHQHLSAYFYGPERDVALFYTTVEGTAQLK